MLLRVVGLAVPTLAQVVQGLELGRHSLVSISVKSLVANGVGRVVIEHTLRVKEILVKLLTVR
jgi:hypothetical protein